MLGCMVGSVLAGEEDSLHRTRVVCLLLTEVIGPGRLEVMRSTVETGTIGPSVCGWSSLL